MLAPARDVLINILCRDCQLFHIFRAPAGQLRARLGQLLIPHIQRTAHGWARQRGLQRLVALLERAIIALERVIIGGADLRQRDVHHAAAFRGAILHSAQILRRKQHARHMPHQLARARGLASGNLYFALALRRHYDLHIVAAVAALGAQLHGGKIRAPADQLPILPRAV